MSNDRYEAALRDPDNLNVLRALSRRYERVLDEDDRDELAHLALLEALDGYRPGSPCKFTTYLYQMAAWMFRDAARTIRRRQRCEHEAVLRRLSAAAWEWPAELDEGPEADSLLGQLATLDEADRLLLTARHVDGRTLRELGHAAGVSRFTAAARVRAAEGRLRARCLDQAV